MIFYLFFRYWFILILLLALSYGLGALFIRTEKKAPFYLAFHRVFIGLIGISALFAVVRSQGWTIQLLFLPWLFYLIQTERKINSSTVPLRQHNSLKALIPYFLLASTLVFSWAFLYRIQAAPFPFFIPSGTALLPNDVHIYSLRSYYLGQSAWENYFGVYNTFDSNFHGLNPYHYLELWLNAGINSLLGGLSVLNLSLVTGPLLQLLSFLGLLAIVEYFRPVKGIHILLALSFLFTAGLYLFYGRIGFPALSLPIVSYPFKLVTYYPFLIGFILAALYRQAFKAILLIMALPIATFVALPSIAALLLLICLANPLLKFSTLSSLKIMAFAILLLGGIGLFYNVMPEPSANSTFTVEGGELSSLLMNFFKDSSVYIQRFAYALTHWGLLYGPFILIGYWTKAFWSKQAFLLYSFIFLLFGAAACYALLGAFAQASQLFYNVVFSFSNCLVILVFIQAYHFFPKSFSWKTGITSVLFMLTLSTQCYLVYEKHILPKQEKAYSTAYLMQIQEWAVAGTLSPIGGALKGAEDYTSEYAKMTTGYVLGYYLQFMRDGITTVSMSDFEIPINPKEERNNLKDIQSGAFYQFVARQKKAQTFTSVEDSKRKFILENAINFLILSQNATLPKSLENKIDQILLDSVSGERFILLNN